MICECGGQMMVIDSRVSKGDRIVNAGLISDFTRRRRYACDVCFLRRTTIEIPLETIDDLIQASRELNFLLGEISRINRIFGGAQ